jgi:hypothetical protein
MTSQRHVPTTGSHQANGRAWFFVLVLVGLVPLHGCKQSEKLKVTNIRQESPTPSVSHSTPPIQAKDSDLMMVMSGIDLAPVLVVQEKVPRAWGKGAPTLEVANEWQVMISQTLNKADIPERFRGMVGTSWKGFDSEKQVCTVKVSGLRLYFENNSDSSKASWNRLYQDVQKKDASLEKKAQLALAIQKEQTSKTTGSLVATFEKSSCADKMVWAQPAKMEEPTYVPLKELPKGTLHTAVSKAFHQLPVFEKIQKVYLKRKKPTDPAHWTGLKDYSEDLNFAKFSAEKTVVTSTSRVCQGYQAFSVNLEVVWLIDQPDSPQPRVHLYSEVRPSSERFMSAVADLNHDSYPDLIHLDQLWLSEGKQLKNARAVNLRLIHTCNGCSAFSF